MFMMVSAFKVLMSLIGSKELHAYIGLAIKLI